MNMPLPPNAHPEERRMVNVMFADVQTRSGQVFPGYIGSKNEYTILGDSVNIASRLEQYAEAGAIMISESTHRLIRGKFSITRPEPVLLKGKHKPVMTYCANKQNLKKPSRSGIHKCQTNQIPFS